MSASRDTAESDGLTGKVRALSRNTTARIAGGFYLAFVLASVLAGLLGHIGMGGADQVYQSIVTNPGTSRLALVVALVSSFLFLMAAWGLYVLLRPVNGRLALLFLLLNTVGVAIQCASMLPLLAALLMSDGGGFIQAFSAAQLEALGLLSAGVYKVGFVTAQIFYGTWLFPLGYLVYKCGFLPRFLGVLLLADGVGVLVWFLQALLLPSLPIISYPAFALGFIAEVGLGLWLAVRGVNGVDAGTARVMDPSPAC
jgi:hypothetical protein